MKKSFSAFIAFGAILLLVTQYNIYAQEIEKVLTIEGPPLTKREFRSLMNPKNHQEHEVVIRTYDSKMDFGGEKGYLMVYYFIKENELKPEWVSTPTEEIYDRLYYNWEPAMFNWEFENTKTGERANKLYRKFE
jgi:hypothetical protein